MTLPRGFTPDKKPNKKDLEDKIVQLETKLKMLDSFLSDEVTPYHFHEEQIKSEESIRELDESIDRKIKEIKGHDCLPKGFANKNIKKDLPKKGIKLKHLLLAGAIIFSLVILIMINEPDYQSEEIIHETEIVQPINNFLSPEIKSKSAQCQKAYTLGPNEWYKKNCM